MTNLPNDVTRCSRADNNCPSRFICERYSAKVTEATPVAALNSRRDAGSSACDMFKGVLPTTFKE